MHLLPGDSEYYICTSTEAQNQPHFSGKKVLLSADPSGSFEPSFIMAGVGVGVYVGVCVHMCVCVYVCVCMCMHVYVCVCMCTGEYTHTHTIYKHINT